MNKIGFDVFFLRKILSAMDDRPAIRACGPMRTEISYFLLLETKKVLQKILKQKTNPRSHVVVFLYYSIFERNANHFSSPYTQKNVCINFQGLPVNRSPTFSRVFKKNRNKKKLFLLFGLT
jgi:hypothetical protein